jgi:hypothetical protein
MSKVGTNATSLSTAEKADGTLKYTRIHGMKNTNDIKIIGKDLLTVLCTKE